MIFPNKNSGYMAPMKWNVLNQECLRKYEMMSPCWVVGAQSTTSALYSGADMQLHSFPPEANPLLQDSLETLSTSTLVVCNESENKN